jgi:predicted nucleotidyltransferase component of viral defense system
MEHRLKEFAKSALFKDAIEVTAKAMNLPTVFVEKDFWVSYVLYQLAHSEHSSQVVFKGGTALSKAYHLLERFSEDVDLALIPDSTRSANRTKNLLKTISSEITQGLEPIDSPITSKGSKYWKIVYQYPQTFKAIEWGQVSNVLILEINAFTHPFPHQERIIQSYIGSHLTKAGFTTEVKSFSLEPFSIQVLDLERTFIEKVLSLVRASYSSDPTAELRNKIRHFYDLHKLVEYGILAHPTTPTSLNQRFKEAQEDDAQNSQFQGEWLNKPLIDSVIFREPTAFWETMHPVYERDFGLLVYGKLPPKSDIIRALEKIATFLQQMRL